MASVGPELPPHLAKRKRSEEAHNPLNLHPKRQRSSSPHPQTTQPRRIIGPAAPPAPLSQRPPTPPDPSPSSSDSDSDSDFGPSLPPLPGSTDQETERKRQATLADEDAAAARNHAATKPQREEWMLLPPTPDDRTSLADPTKLKNRKFNTGKGSKAAARNGDGAAADNTLWTETPEQKRQRLADEVMGVVKRPARSEGKRDGGRGEEEVRETQRRIKEFDERERSGSLYSAHQKAGPRKKEGEDDPSGRAFDREKDMGLGAKIGHRQKRELLDKAKDFGARFEKGSYL